LAKLTGESSAMIAIRLMLAASLATSSPAAIAADSGEFPGVYVREGSTQPLTAAQHELLQLKCLLAPDTMHEDGSGAGYFLDAPLFLSRGQVAYIKGEEYRCTYSPKTRMETCESQEFSDGKGLRYFRTNVYVSFTQDLQRGNSLMTPEDVVAWNESGTRNPDTLFAYHRCTCVTREQVESRAARGINTLSGEETGQKRYGWRADPAAQDYEVARKVMEAIGSCRLNLS
jgi:hypothetical protein